MGRKPLGMTEAEACQVLEVKLAEGQELDDEMLKAAYRSDPAPCANFCIYAEIQMARPEAYSVQRYRLKHVHVAIGGLEH